MSLQVMVLVWCKALLWCGWTKVLSFVSELVAADLLGAMVYKNSNVTTKK